MQQLAFIKAVPVWMRRLWALVRLLRPVNVAIIMLGAALGGVLAGGMAALQGEVGSRLGLAMLSAGLIGAAANSLNDALDVEIDRVNRPERPLPAGWIAVRTARLLWVAGSVGGIALSAMLSAVHVALALAAVGLMVIYNALLKRTPLLGNLVVAGVIGLVLVYGGWVAGTPGRMPCPTRIQPMPG